MPMENAIMGTGIRVCVKTGKPQISPLRCASVEMTNLLGNRLYWAPVFTHTL
jgi:hypothetical protein